jgi:flagellar hook-associated protein 2
MPDINLPGVSSKIDVKEIIDNLVKVESKKLDRLEKAKEKFDKEKSAWITLGNKLKELQDSSKELYGFRSPFDSKIALSGNEAIVTAEAARIAEPSKSMVRVEQVARNERILSDPIPDNLVLKKEPHLVFAVGDEEVDVHFEGGRASDLVKSINEQAPDLLVAKITKDTEDTSVIVLESKKPGDRNRISVTDRDALSFFTRIGLFEEKAVLEVDTGLIQERVEALGEKTGHSIEDATLVLEPGSGAVLPFDTPVEAKQSVMVSVKVRAVDIPMVEVEQPKVVWPELRDIGTVTVKDVTIQGGRAVTRIEKEVEKKPEEEPVVVDNRVFGLVDTRGQKRTVEIDEIGGEFRELHFRLTDIVPEGTSVSGIIFKNENTARRIEYRDIVVEDTSQRGGIVPSHLVQEAKDSVIYIDGVQVKRSSNDIDDAVEGVTLRLLGESDEEVEITVERDYERITEKIIDMIEKYNGLLKFINDGMKVVPSGTLDEDNEVGVLTGDITVLGLKNRLQNIMMNPYPTSRGKELSLLAQIGISMGAHGTSWGDIKGGYLQVDEDQFIEALRKYPEEVKELFGSDTNKDVKIDNGVAWVMERNIKGYTDPQTGIVAYHIKNTDSNIKSQESRIEDWNDHLEEYRKKLESDFTLMQQALNEMEQSQKSLENFSKQFGNK